MKFLVSGLREVSPQNLGRLRGTPHRRDSLSPESGETGWNPAPPQRALPGIRGDWLEPRPGTILLSCLLRGDFVRNSKLRCLARARISRKVSVAPVAAWGAEFFPRWLFTNWPDINHLASALSQAALVEVAVQTEELCLRMFHSNGLGPCGAPY